ncbi:MAG: hypothetical protein KGK07_15600 [Chloroflexota bacterium]|nr:hypothetical protein [Chloroflexota bacterium]
MSKPRPKPSLDHDREAFGALLGAVEQVYSHGGAPAVVIPARPCGRCGGEVRVPRPETPFQRAERLLQRRAPLPPPRQCPVCYGSGAVDLWRELEVSRAQAARLRDAMHLLCEYALATANQEDAPHPKCLRLIGHALQAHMGDVGEPPERVRGKDLGFESDEREDDAQ